MVIVDSHVHSTFSIDGISTMEEHCVQAIKKGVSKLCFTEHVDFNIAEYNLGKIKDNRKQNFVIEEYFDEILRLNAKYTSIEILSGVEFSEPHLFPEAYEYYEQLPFDYLLASVHHCYNGIFPGKANIQEKVAINEYYSLMKESLQFCTCQAIAHLDFPRRYFDSWNISNQVLTEILSIIIEKGIALEINTSSVNETCPEPLPNYGIIKRYQQLGGKRIILGSDAHDFSKLANCFNKVIDNLPQGLVIGYVKKREFIPLY